MLLTYKALLQPLSRSRHHTLYLAGIKANHRSFRSTEHGNGGMRAVDLERQYRVLTGKDTRYSKLGPSNPHLKVKTTQRQIMTENPVPKRTLEDDLQIELCQHVFKGPVSASRASLDVGACPNIRTSSQTVSSIPNSMRYISSLFRHNTEMKIPGYEALGSLSQMLKSDVGLLST